MPEGPGRPCNYANFVSLENFVIVMRALSLHNVLHQTVFFKLLSSPRLGDKLAEKNNYHSKPFLHIRSFFTCCVPKLCAVNLLHPSVTNTTWVRWRSCPSHEFLRTGQAPVYTQLCLIMAGISIIKEATWVQTGVTDNIKGS